MKKLLRAAIALLAASACAPAMAQYSPGTSAPPLATSLTGNEVFGAVQNGRGVTVSLSQLAGLSGGGLTAGTITGLPGATTLTGTEGGGAPASRAPARPVQPPYSRAPTRWAPASPAWALRAR